MTAYALEEAANKLVAEVKKLENISPEMAKALLVYEAAGVLDCYVDSDSHEDISVEDIMAAVDAVDVNLKNSKDYAWEQAITRWLFDNVYTIQYPLEKYPLCKYEHFINRWFAKKLGLIDGAKEIF